MFTVRRVPPLTTRSPVNLWVTIAIGVACLVPTVLAVFGVSVLSGPYLPYDPPAPRAALVPQAPESQESVAVDPSSVSALPLLDGAVQQYVAPPQISLSARDFVYAQFPQDVTAVEQFLVQSLPRENWVVHGTTDLVPSGVVLDVTSPSGSTGSLRVEPLPRTVPGLRTQVVGDLERSLVP